MSDEHASVRLPKWPFYAADLLLSAIIVFVLYQLGTFEGTTEMWIVIGCLVMAAVAAWISIIPWLKEHNAQLHLNESSNLKSAVEQIKGLEKVADLIRQSNAQWQGIQDTSARTVASAKEITERMKLEADEFMKFLSSAHDQEKAGLRLEVEKLRRMEGDGIKVVVQILDHVYALFRAAERSGQRNLIAQLTHFQGACRDVARRIGLSAFLPERGENFDGRAHQLTDPKATAPEGARVGEVLAPGFTYQGGLLRRSLVVLEGMVPPHGTAEVKSVPEPEMQSTQPEPETAPSEPGGLATDLPPEAPVDKIEAENEAAELPPDVEVFESLDQLEPEPLEPESEPKRPVERLAELERAVARLEGGGQEVERTDTGMQENAPGSAQPDHSQPKKKSPQDELPF